MRSLRTITPTLSRISASHSRSVAVARMTAATGLFSSWVRPAVTEPSATKRSCRSTIWLASAPWVAAPSSRWAAIGNHFHTALPKSSAGIS